MIELQLTIQLALLKYNLPIDHNFLYHIAVVESNCKPAKQINGTALGWFQIEPWVARDIIEHTDLMSYKKVRIVMDNEKRFKFALQYDLDFQVLLARKQFMRYEHIDGEIPPLIEDQAKLWKKRWNTHLGRGEIETFIKKNKGK